jgi:hypothetical protein
MLPMFDASERLDQIGAHDFQLAAVVRGELVKQTRAFGGDAQQDAAGILLVAGALQQALLLRSVCQLDYAVVSQAKALGRVGNGGDCIGRRSGNLQQQLMLLRLKSGIVGGLLAELHESAKAIAKFGEALDQVCRGVSYIFH